MSDWEFPKAPGDQENIWERFSTLFYFPKSRAISAVLSPVHLEVCSSYQVVNYIVFTECAIVLDNQWLVYINCWRDGGHGYHYPATVCLQGSSLGKCFILCYLRLAFNVLYEHLQVLNTISQQNLSGKWGH